MESEIRGVLLVISSNFDGPGIGIMLHRITQLPKFGPNYLNARTSIDPTHGYKCESSPNKKSGKQDKLRKEQNSRLHDTTRTKRIPRPTHSRNTKKEK